MKTFDEAFTAALAVSTPDHGSPEFEMVAKNLDDQAREILANPWAMRWAYKMAELAWDKLGDEIGQQDVMGFFLSGLCSGVRIGIEMEKE